MSELVKYELNEKVATLTLNNGKVNAVSPDLVDALNAALDRAEQDQAVVVITGRFGMLSGGYDLTVMKDSEASAKALIRKGSTLTRRLLSFPTPVVVACSGHAIAKGAFLLLAADVRIGVDGPFKIGLNEVAIGMTMHHVGIELARDRLTSAAFSRSVLCAELFAPEAAKEMGFLDTVVGEDAFMPTVSAVAQQLSQLDMKAHHITKLKARSDLLATLDAGIEKDFETPFESEIA